MGSTTNNNNDEISIESTEGPGGPNASTSASMSKRKKCALAVFLSVGLLALVIGLSVGLGTKNGQRSTSSANSSANAAALTLEDCLADEEAANADAFNVADDDDADDDDADDDEANDDEAADMMDDFTYSPTYSPVPDESVETRASNDAVAVVDIGNRDLRGSIAVKRIASSKGKEPFDSSNQSRRLQCEDLMNANMSKGANSKSAKGAKKLTAPFCETVKRICNSGTRLEGRGNVGGKAKKGAVMKGSEFMQPNTLDDCEDRSNGQPNDISIQKISVRSNKRKSGTRPLLGEGRKAEIIVNVEARANSYGESRGFVYGATDAYDPKWKYIDEFVVTKSGRNLERIDYTIPEGTGEKGVQAVRVRYGFNIGKGRCGGGGNGNLYADVDDIAFAVNVPAVKAEGNLNADVDDLELIADDSVEDAVEGDADEDTADVDDANVDDLN
mmetsp:Transcript_19886/g.31255  ORF Transcript_19886/g.31255 Transcript_19886/m.31255 type:complete len:444 (-) Transcript_19886:17-1348(-)